MFTDDRQALWWSLVAGSFFWHWGEAGSPCDGPWWLGASSGAGERQAVPVMVLVAGTALGGGCGALAFAGSAVGSPGLCWYCAVGALLSLVLCWGLWGALASLVPCWGTVGSPGFAGTVLGEVGSPGLLVLCWGAVGRPGFAGTVLGAVGSLLCWYCAGGCGEPWLCWYCAGGCGEPWLHWYCAGGCGEPLLRWYCAGGYGEPWLHWYCTGGLWRALALLGNLE